MRLRILVLCVASSLALFPAGPSAAQPGNAFVTAACGDNAVKFAVHQEKEHSVFSAPPGKALVYVIAQGAYIDKPDKCGVVTRVGMDGHWVGANCEHSYMMFKVDPGEHHLCSNWQTKVFYHSQPASILGFNAKPESVYFFRAAIYANTEAPMLIDLEPLNPDEARLLLSTELSSGSRVKH